MKSFINRTEIHVRRLTLIGSLLLLVVQSVLAQQDSSKLRFADKITHWQIAYGMSGPEFMEQVRNNFKASAFAEVYIEGTIDHGAWMFTLLNKVTKFRYQDKTTPYVLFEVKFKPTTPNLDGYQVILTLTASQQVSANLSKIAGDAAAKYLGNKTYADPSIAVPDIESTLTEAMTVLDEKLGDELAPNLMVKYKDEVFWNGHDIPITDADGNFVELEAIGKDGRALNPADITWTNADPFQSKGVVDMTGVNSKSVTLKKTDDDKPLVVTIKRANTEQDLRELLKMLIVEVLSTKKQQAMDTIPRLKGDSARNASEVAAQIALLEQSNYPLEDIGIRPVGLFSVPPDLSSQDARLFDEGPKNAERKKGFDFLRKRKWLSSTIRKKVNVVAFANLVVDQPERMNELLEALLTNSGRLIARLILNTNSEGQRDAIRNVVVDFLNRNLEQIAGGAFGFEEDEVLPAIAPSVRVTSIAADKKLSPTNRLYINPDIEFHGKQEFITKTIKHLDSLDTPTYVVINYSQDLSTDSYIGRAQAVKPKDIPEGYAYLTITLVNIPGSTKLQVVGSKPAEVNSSGNITDILWEYLKQDVILQEGSSSDYALRIMEYVRCAWIGQKDVTIDDTEISKAAGAVELEVEIFDGGVPVEDLSISSSDSKSSDFILSPQSPSINDDRTLRTNFKYQLQYAAHENKSISFLHDDRAVLERIQRYLKPGTAEYESSISRQVAALKKLMLKSKENIDEITTILLQLGCATSKIRSADTRFEILKLISSNWDNWNIVELFTESKQMTTGEQKILVDLITTLPDKNERIKLYEKLRDDDTGVLKNCLGTWRALGGEEHIAFHKALTELFFEGEESKISTAATNFESVFGEEKYNNLLDNDYAEIRYLTNNKIFLWSDPGFIKFIFQTQGEAMDYENFLISTSNELSFKVDHTSLTEHDYDADVSGLKAFEPVLVMFLTSTDGFFDVGGINGTIQGGVVLVPAITLQLLDQNKFNQQLLRSFDAVTFFVPFGIFAKAGKWGLAAYETVLFAIQQGVNDYALELGATEQGRAVLRSWMFLNIFISVAELHGNPNIIKGPLNKVRRSLEALPLNVSDDVKRFKSKILGLINPAPLGKLASRLPEFPKLAEKLDALESLVPGTKKKFLDDFANASDEVVNRLGMNPQVADAWRAVEAFPELRKNLGTIELLQGFSPAMLNKLTAVDLKDATFLSRINQAQDRLIGYKAIQEARVTLNSALRKDYAVLDVLSSQIKRNVPQQIGIDLYKDLLRKYSGSCTGCAPSPGTFDLPPFKSFFTKIETLVSKYKGRNIEGFDDFLRASNNAAPAAQDGFSFMMERLITDIDPRSVSKMDAEFEAQGVVCTKCRMDLELNGDPRTFREYKSWGIEGVSGIQIRQLTEYFRSVTSLDYMKFIFNKNKTPDLNAVKTEIKKIFTDRTKMNAIYNSIGQAQFNRLFNVDNVDDFVTDVASVTTGQNSIYRFLDIQ